MRRKIAGFGPAVLSLVALLAVTAAPAQQSALISASSIPAASLVQPAQLRSELQSRHPPLIFQVGSRVLFDEGHIPGARYAGPASRPAGLEALRQSIASLPRGRSIVLYCGCCPWDHCPNIGPAWQLLHRMGFTRVRALYIADNFGSAWIALGYPVESSVTHAH